jgi:CRP-like cAMP-binding protein/Fe-S-cluster-containing hydrogenase component 2
MSRILDYLPQGWNVPLLLSRLREQPMFNDPKQVSENYLLHFIASSKILTFLPGTTVMHEGEYGREISLILEGRFSISSLGPRGEELLVAVVRRGEFLGERGMLTGQRRGATARTETAAVVLEVPEQVMQRMMEMAPGVKHYFEHLNNLRSLESILRGLHLFQGLSETDTRWLIGQTQVKQYDREERFLSEENQEQTAREKVHVLLEGFVKVARRTAAGTGRQKSDERIIAYRQGGDYFIGGLDLLGDGSAASVTAITRVRVAEIPHQAMQALLARYPGINQHFQARLQNYRESALMAKTQTFIGPVDFLRSGASTSFAEAEARKDLRAIVGDGVVEGTEVLVIDLGKCIHCNECEEACARRHGHSRMNRQGMVVGNMTIATACRQCQDPVCMLCSRAGIARMPSGEVYITESCIGCGICAERCPYDNISIVSLEEPQSTEPLPVLQESWKRFSTFFGKGLGKERGRKMLPMAGSAPLTDVHAAPGPLDAPHPYDAFGEIRKKLAIKCDLCAGYENQACVQACPTGAALRVQPGTFFGSTEDILRMRAK